MRIVSLSVITFSNVLERRLRRSISCLTYSLSEVILLGGDRLELLAFFLSILMMDNTFMVRFITLGLVDVRIRRVSGRIRVFNYVKRTWAYIPIVKSPLLIFLWTSLYDQNLWLLLLGVFFLHHCLNWWWCTNDSSLLRFGLLDNCLAINLWHFVIGCILILAETFLGSLGLLLLADCRWCKLRRLFLRNLFDWGEMRACNLINSWHHDVLHGLEIAGDRAIGLNRTIECHLIMFLIVVLRTRA